MENQQSRHNRFFELILIPVIIGVLLLLLEYNFFQRDSNKENGPNSTPTKDTTTLTMPERKTISAKIDKKKLNKVSSNIKEKAKGSNKKSNEVLLDSNIIIVKIPLNSVTSRNNETPNTGGTRNHSYFQGREVLDSCKLSDSSLSQETGTICIMICIDRKGNVVSAEYTQKGSSSDSNRLRKLAIENAECYKFSEGGPEKQCGIIPYIFKVK